MTTTPIRWYAVMLPGETADQSELFGPFRSETHAQQACDDWNAAYATNGDEATVMPIFSARDLKDAK